MCLMILAKIAQSTKNATTPTIHTINNSVTILLNFDFADMTISGAKVINSSRFSVPILI